MKNASRLDGGRRTALLFAAGLAACLALVNWRLLTAEIEVSPIVPPDAVTGSEIAVFGWTADANARTEPQTFPETLARPLFRSTRRPVEAEKPQTAQRPQAAAKQPAKLPESLELVGIMKTDGRDGKALIRLGGSPGQWVEVGHVLQGWRVSQIEAASILFEAEGRRETLSLFPRKSE